MFANRYTINVLLLTAALLTGIVPGLRAQEADTQAAAVQASATADSMAQSEDTVRAPLDAAPEAAAPPQSITSPVLSSRITLSDDLAELELGLAGGGALDLELRRGRVRIGDRDVGITYPPGGELDRAWRALLESANDQSPAVLAAILVGWAAEPPANPAGAALAQAIQNSLGERVAAAALAREGQDTVSGADTAAAAAPLADSIEELNDQLEGLRDDYYDLLDERDSEFVGISGDELRREIREEVEAELRREFSDMPFPRFVGAWWNSPLDNVWDGIGGAMATLFLYGLLVALGAGLVYLGRDHLMAVSTTARRYTLRSWLVGLAGSFLILPAFLLGIIALSVSVIGIPALLAWIPIYPIAIVATFLFGYLAVAYATGEAVTENKKLNVQWLKRHDPYVYMLTGVAVLLVLFLLANAFQMVGPWFGFIHGLIASLAFFITWLAFTIGFGAVLVSRFGTRPLAPAAAAALPAETEAPSEENHE